jgi:hypothetical protein
MHSFKNDEDLEGGNKLKLCYYISLVLFSLTIGLITIGDSLYEIFLVQNSIVSTAPLLLLAGVAFYASYVSFKYYQFYKCGAPKPLAPPPK